MGIEIYPQENIKQHAGSTTIKLPTPVHPVLHPTSAKHITLQCVGVLMSPPLPHPKPLPPPLIYLKATTPL